MSFSSDIKNELCEVSHSRKSRILLAKGAAYAMNQSATGLYYNTENKQVCDCIASALELSGTKYTITENHKKNGCFYLTEIYDTGFAGEIPDLSEDDRLGVFLRGVFLVCGFAADPEKMYQLELFLGSAEKCELLSRLIAEHGMSIKTSQRRGSSFLYLKESERISDFLTFIGGMNASMEIMNVKIYKEVRNNVNRTVNCESANLDKTVAAAQTASEDIKYIFNTKGRGYLPEELEQVALIRLDAPELSLSDIGKRLEPPITKSGVNHRLKRISAVAQRLREGKER